jgi:hypothetical protein
MIRASRPPACLLLALAVLAAGCGSPDETRSAAPDGSRQPPAATPAPGSSLAIALDKLDPNSRILAGLIDTDEIVDARLDTGDPVNVLRDVRAGGGTAHLVSDTIVLTRAPFSVVLAALGRIDVGSGSIAEDLSAKRRIAGAAPKLDVPSSGVPYAEGDFRVDGAAVSIPAFRLEPMIGALRGSIATFDGRPYASLAVDGGCQPDTCRLTAMGLVDGAVPQTPDVWVVRAAAVNNWLPTGDARDRDLRAIPRSLQRAAEWIARSELAVAKRIATYTFIAGFAWQPGDPVLIRIDYQRECPAAVGPAGARLADDMVCRDTLGVLVDVRAGTVVDVVETKGVA